VLLLQRRPEWNDRVLVVFGPETRNMDNFDIIAEGIELARHRRNHPRFLAALRNYIVAMGTPDRKVSIHRVFTQMRKDGFSVSNRIATAYGNLVTDVYPETQDLVIMVPRRRRLQAEGVA